MFESPEGEEWLEEWLEKWLEEWSEVKCRWIKTQGSQLRRSLAVSAINYSIAH
jgi:DNA-binding PadR family transcriptional regulator